MPIIRIKQLAVELLVLAVAVAAAAGMLYFGMQRYYHAAYPMKYVSLIEAASEERGLDPALVFAVVRTESNFRPDVTSNKGARGLMQLMPDAYDWIQMRRGLTVVEDKEILFDPQVNVETGTTMLRLLLDEFQSDVNALCAYHAGRGRVQEWLKNPNYSSDGKQVTHIPFDDTRAYVERVLKTREIYRTLYEIPQ